MIQQRERWAGDKKAWLLHEMATVFDDGAKDVMTGSSGVDWFFANLEADKGGVLDKITDLDDDEFAEDLQFIESEV